MRARRGRHRRPATSLLEVPPDIERKTRNRQLKLQEPMAWLDQQPPLTRALFAYFGTERAGRALQYANPEDVAAYLRDPVGFAAYFAEWPKPPPKAAAIAFNWRV